MSQIKFSQNTSIQVEAYENLYSDTETPIAFPTLVTQEHEKLNAVAKQMLMNNLSSFKNFFTSSLEAQNEMLTRKFGVTTNSGYFNDEALQTFILAPYLSLLFGLMSRSVHLVYASVRQEFFNLDLWADMMFTEYLEFYNLAHTSEAFPNAGKKDDNPPSSSFSTHQSPPIMHHITEEILNTSDHIIVDPPPVTSQEKGKSRADDLPLNKWVPVLQKDNNKMTKAGR
jgi:hypothetical protein